MLLFYPQWFKQGKKKKTNKPNLHTHETANQVSLTKFNYPSYKGRLLKLAPTLSWKLVKTCMTLSYQIKKKKTTKKNTSGFCCSKASPPAKHFSLSMGYRSQIHLRCAAHSELVPPSPGAFQCSFPHGLPFLALLWNTIPKHGALAIDWKLNVETQLESQQPNLSFKEHAWGNSSIKLPCWQFQPKKDALKFLKQ